MPETQETSDNQEESNNKKERRSRARLWFVLYGVLVLTGLSIGSYYFGNGADRAKFWTEGLLSAAVLSIVALQAYIYWKQTRVMERQLKATESAANAAKQALYIAERPYLDVAALSVSPYPFEAHKPITYKARIENTGRTPAYDMEGATYLEITPDRLHDTPEYKPLGRPMSKSNLGPGRHHTFYRTTPDLDLQPTDIAAIESGVLILYVYGVVKYKDGFTPRIHRLRYCQEYNHLIKNMAVTSYHNESR